ncbi:DUF397 domain-containing protein [Streptomyces sp. NPDC048441]|uniref:DUF397 domain-containing protein n=1 Tax=Streptomyces sp. NPDC048441 TaxID=3365552 RepID=UPI0037122B6F
MPELKWVKSSHSEASGNACVEIAVFGDLIAVRDSKDAELAMATVGRGAWVQFTGALAKGLMA